MRGVSLCVEKELCEQNLMEVFRIMWCDGACVGPRRDVAGSRL